MTNEQLKKAIVALQNISINFKIDYFLFSGKCEVRGIIIHNPEDLSKVKSILDADILKNFKIKKSKEWYLGDPVEVTYLQLKKKIVISIEEYESFHVNNYA
ncbi:MAG TPA: hypothetical protein PKE39_06705 [Ignavibacteria bacterium]|nr:hypothetical protein [Ignavibacteria bacterium]HMQ98699.1 hypothetical protein [Ignavibacteria bacterium]